MIDTDQEVFELIHRAGDGPVGDPPIADVMQEGSRRRRRRRREQVGGIAAVVVVVAVVAVFGFTHSSSPLSPRPTTPLAAGPGISPQQLVSGHWRKLPSAPIKACQPLAAWDGSKLVVIEAGVNKCSAAAATYDPATNTWARISAPPAVAGQQPAAAFAAGRLVLVAPATGATVTWTPSTGRWHQIASVPAPKQASRGEPPALSMTAAGGTIDLVDINDGIPRAFALDAADHWTALPNLDLPSSGRVSLASLAVEHGALYALVGVSDPAVGPVTGGHVELQQLIGGHWIRVQSALPQLGSEPGLTPLDNALLAVGQVCRGDDLCMEDEAAADLVRPSDISTATALRLRNSLETPVELAGGGRSVLALYPAGFHPLHGPVAPSGATELYNIRAHAWMRGPTFPHYMGGVVQLVVTSRGVVALTLIDGGASPVSIGGELLRPAA